MKFPASNGLVRALPALIVALPAAVGVWAATVRASWASLGRDQGIFQYVAWAVGQGDVAYRDVRDVNGPVVMMVHAAFQSVGGADEHRFRVLDLAVTGLTFALAGACIPSIRTRAREPVAVSERVLWALAAWVALSAQYVVYGFWDTAQRESFLDWFMLASIALSGAGVGSARPAVGFVAGALSFVPWLGKPTYAAFTAAQIVALVLEPATETVSRRRRLVVFLAGGFVGASIPFLYLVARGDLAAWARITFIDVPAMYRFIWPTPATEIVRLPGYSQQVALALATSVGLGGLIALRRLPPRAIPIAAMPVLGCVSVFVQAKGFPYHFHPVTLGTTFGWLVGLAALWQPPVPWQWRRLGVAAAAGIVGSRAMLLAERAPDPPAPAADARDKASLDSGERLSAFNRVDFFPRALRDAAGYLAARTSPTDRVQMYGMDAYLLFLAGRRSATPYVYAYDLNVDAALVGSYSPEGLHPNADQIERIRAIRDEHEKDLFARLERSPPAAFVFVDRSPLMSSADAVVDFSLHCPEVFAWLARHYRQTAEFDPIRIWLRREQADQEDRAVE